MILVGRNVSPFVRRTSIVLKLLGVTFEQKMLSTAENLAEITISNPIGRVPALILDSGEVLVDSNAIIDYLLEKYDKKSDLLPVSGSGRRLILRTTAIAIGTAEKGVASSYERTRRPSEKIFLDWLDRLESQAAAGLHALEEMASATDSWFHGKDITLADITTICAYDYIAQRVASLLNKREYPGLARISAKGNSIDQIRETYSEA